MMRVRLFAVLLLVAGCDSVGGLEPLPDSGSCSADVNLTILGAELGTDGSVQIAGTTKAPSSVTVRAIYVANVAVSKSDYNFRGWSLRLAPDVVRLLTRNGGVSVDVTAFTSDGCETSSIHVSAPLRDAGDDTVDAAPSPSGNPGDGG